HNQPHRAIPVFPYATLFRSHHDPERRRRLEPAGVVAPFVVRRVLGDVRDGSAILAAQAQALDEAKEQKDNPRRGADLGVAWHERSEEHTSELQSLAYLVCRL